MKLMDVSMTRVDSRPMTSEPLKVANLGIQFVECLGNFETNIEHIEHQQGVSCLKKKKHVFSDL